MTGELATEKWYNEMTHFDFTDKKFNPATGHFTQVVWKESIEIGAAVATADNGMHFYVARYKFIQLLCCKVQIHTAMCPVQNLI